VAPQREAETTRRRTLPRVATLLAVVVAALVVTAPALGAGTAPAWVDPTPGEGATVAASGGTATTIAFAAADPDPGDVVQLEARGLPRYATWSATPGDPAAGSILVTPPATAHAVVTLTLIARDASGNATARTIIVRVTVDTRPFSLAGPRGRSQWGYLLEATTARAAPSRGARPVARLGTATPLGNPNLVLALEGQRDERGTLWVRVRLPILPNGSTGWIKRSALDELHVVRTRLVVDRALLRATLFRDDQAIFTTPVGVGRALSPTPAGEFYVREILRGFGDRFYGPVAFGTNGRSRVFTDWPGGGFIGIHGTNDPRLIPGRVSHGCIRMRNDAIVRLARLMPLGTPVTVR
jgi:hypothetical protein